MGRAINMALISYMVRISTRLTFHSMPLTFDLFEPITNKKIAAWQPIVDVKGLLWTYQQLFYGWHTIT